MKAEAAYMKGDYKAYVDFGAKRGDVDLMMARALEKLKRYKESLAVYKLVAQGLKGTGDIKGLKRAYIGAADTSFMLRRYTGAIGYYRTLLKLIEKDGNGDTSWALFRITQSYAKLKKRDKQRDALKAIKKIDDTFGRSAEPLFGGRVGNL
jgi:tetratricopeptide (TPR) repeat protein